LQPALAPLASAAGDFARNAYGPRLEALGIRVEDKDAIWAFHWRGAPDEAAARKALEAVAADAERGGLVPHWGRMVLEIRPRVAADKGTAVASTLDGRDLARALYAGDDTTDLDAFRELRALAAAGRIGALCVGVHSTEGPAEIERDSDLVVDGPAGVVSMLEALA
jgi:trehalose 6-phosphate phosphatase